MDKLIVNYINKNMKNDKSIIHTHTPGLDYALNLCQCISNALAIS